jgi:phosphoglycolate phosphatase
MANELKVAVFDLDGTLVNTIDDLKIACDTVLKEYGRDYEWSVDDYKRFVGNGIKKLVERAFDHTLNEAELDEAFRKASALYNEIKLDHAHAYDGIKEQLNLLKAKGLKLAVVTNKPDAAAKNMVETIFGKGTFDFISGAAEGTPHKPHPASTLRALDALGCKPDKAIFFGDSNVDMQTAKNAGIKAIGVTWGFRSRQELEKEHPFKIIENTDEINTL